VDKSSILLKSCSPAWNKCLTSITMVPSIVFHFLGSSILKLFFFLELDHTSGYLSSRKDQALFVHFFHPDPAACARIFC
jgi:hypothetical protein